MSDNVHPSPKKHELEWINGIGEKTRKALVENGIKNIAMLANSNSDRVESILDAYEIKNKMKFPPHQRTRDVIEQWIQYANEYNLVQEKSVTKINNPDDNALIQIPKFSVQFFYGHIADGQNRWKASVFPYDNIPYPDEWNPNPNEEGYTVEFKYQSEEDNQNRWQTKVYNGKSDKFEDITGWTPDQWWTWISKKASLNEGDQQRIPPSKKAIAHSPDASNDDKPTSTNDASEEKALQITRFEVHLPAKKQENTLVADISFIITETQMKNFPLQFQIEVVYVNLRTDVSHLACSKTIQLIPEKREFETQIEFEMPELGRYQAHCIVLSLPTGEYGDYSREECIFNIVSKEQMASKSAQEQ